jgi:hypothetical protein
MKTPLVSVRAAVGTLLFATTAGLGAKLIVVDTLGVPLGEFLAGTIIHGTALLIHVTIDRVLPRSE